MKELANYGEIEEILRKYDKLLSEFPCLSSYKMESKSLQDQNQDLNFSQHEKKEFFDKLKDIIEKIDPLEPGVETIWNFESFNQELDNEKYFNFQDNQSEKSDESKNRNHQNENLAKNQFLEIAVPKPNSEINIANDNECESTQKRLVINFFEDLLGKKGSKYEPLIFEGKSIDSKYPNLNLNFFLNLDEYFKNNSQVNFLIEKISEQID
ncbi:hypothetical protein BpHYR1_010357 [Brachionus plicatilis]|uniref:Uncharacterized protein n=1 Tax=Brachionus plicatilis TaxID=10195 RepID=A0A3M7QCC8_BRAPC|nr:hypothetical protein BpHYR1_010357 [Brachionus plicatilis]